MSLVLKYRIGIVFACLWTAVVPAALAGPPRFTRIDYPGATKTFVYDVNPAGDIVGAFVDANGEHGFVLHGGEFTSFDYPGATWTDAYGINPEGDIVGQYGLADKTTHGFLLRHGDFYAIEVDGPHDAGLANSMAYKISPDGTIVGCYHQSSSTGAAIAGTMHGFSLNADGLTFNANINSMNLGVNPSGDITGYMSVATDPRSYVVSGGIQTWFVVPGAAVTRASGINDSGDIVGWYKDASAHLHGFLLSEGVFTTLDVAFEGVKQTQPFAINAEGDIVGYFLDATGYHGFLYSRRSLK